MSFHRFQSDSLVHTNTENSLAYFCSGIDILHCWSDTHQYHHSLIYQAKECNPIGNYSSNSLECSHIHRSTNMGSDCIHLYQCKSVCLPGLSTSPGCIDSNNYRHCLHRHDRIRLCCRYIHRGHCKTFGRCLAGIHSSTNTDNPRLC